MKRGLFIVVCLLLLLFTVCPTPAQAVEGMTGIDLKGSVQQIPDPGKSRGFKDGEVLVRFKKGVTDRQKSEKHNKHHGQRIKEFSRLNIDQVKLGSGISVEEAVAIYKADPDVVYAEPDFVVRTQLVPSDPLFNQLWGLNNTGQTGGAAGADIKAPAAWNTTTGSSTVVVAVIDTGIDYAHPDLAANVWVNAAEIPNNGIDDDGNGYVDDVYGINAITGTGNPFDDNGHGTHVAGTIGAVGNNGIGVAGVNWNVRMIGCKFLNGGGSGYLSDAITCLEYVRDLKARGSNIVATSNSWGGGDFSQALRDAIEAQMQDNIMFIAAAGNDRSDNDVSPSYPANYDLLNVLSVAATDASDKKASFSNYGRNKVHLAAPGVNILSTLPPQNIWNITGGYGQLSGTSMATPHVTGLAALLRSQKPTWSSGQVFAQIAGTTDLNADQTLGAGRINAHRALTETPSRTRLVYYGRTLDDISGNSNGVIDAGEAVNIVVELRNLAAPVQGVSATLSTADPYVTISQGTAFIGDMASWSKAANSASPFVVTVSPEAPKLHKITFTLQFIANSGAYSASEVLEERVSPFVPGWPVRTTLGTTFETHPALSDLDGDGLPEAVIASNAGVYAIKGDGSVLPGWPQSPGSWTSPAVGDIDNDGKPEIVIASFTKIYAWRADGTLMPGFPRAPVSGSPYFGEVSLADLDSDEALEIIVAENYGGKVYALKFDGTLLPGWPVSTGEGISSNGPSVGDIDNDGFPEVIVGTKGNRVFAWHRDGALATGWPITTPTPMRYPATIGDVDNDGLPEIFMGTNDYYIYGVRGTGAALPGWPKRGAVAALGDLNQDGYLEIVPGSTAYRWDGTVLPGWGYGLVPFWSPSLADLDNDGYLEILFRYADNKIYAFHADGRPMADFPITLGPSSTAVFSALALGDVNGDGLLDMVTGSIGSDGSIYAFGLPAALPDDIVWPMNQHDSRHTGSIHTPFIETPSMRFGKVDRLYSKTLSATGGSRPYTWSITNGALPNGLTLNAATGEISGKPVSAGTYVFTTQVADSRTQRATKIFSLSVYAPETITTSVLNDGMVGADYTQGLTASGGVMPYRWSVISGVLPEGLILNSVTGVISGTPAVAGTSIFTVQVTDQDADTTTKQLSITVVTPYIRVTEPNGGESWRRGSSYTIGWNYKGSLGSNVSIELLKGGVLNRTITSSTSIGTNGAGAFSWKIPNSQTKGSDYKIQIRSTTDSTYTDASDLNFKVQ